MNYVVTYFLFVFLIWAISEINTIQKATTKNEYAKKESIRNNTILTYGTVLLMIFMLVMLFVNLFINPIFMFKHIGLSVFGSSLALFGIIFRKVAIKQLKSNFDGLVQVKENQQVIQTGLYKYFRHPSYTGSFLTYFGFGLASMNALSMISLPVFLFFVYQERIKIEEELLIEGFGEEYVSYQRKTWGLLPLGRKTLK